MSQQDYQVTLACLQKQHTEVTASKTAAIKYLKDIGVLNAHGKEIVRQPRVCTPQDRG